MPTPTRPHHVLPLLLMLLGVACNPSAPITNPLTEAADAVVDPLDLSDGPGGVAGVYLDGEIVYARGFGLANIEHGIPNTPSTVFRTGSVAKQFTAMAIAMLAQWGEIDLDEDIRTWFPELPEYPEGVVTVRHLVHHTSGFRDYNTLAGLSGLRSDRLSTSEGTFALLARQRGLNFPPGDRFLYSNSGYFLMSELVERVTGKTLAEFAEEEMFGPLGMESSLFKDDHQAVVPNRAYGYVRGEDDRWRLYLSQRDFVGAGGVFTTVEDMLPWLVNLDDNQLGEPGLADLMHQVGILNDGTALDYAFGLRVTAGRGVPEVSHSGGFAAFNAYSLRYPEQGLAVFTAANGGGTVNSGRLALELADIYLASLVPDLPDRPAPTPGGNQNGRNQESTGPSLTPSELQAFAGDYYGYEVDATYRVSVDGDALEISRPDGNSVRVEAFTPTSFRGNGLVLSFDRASSGEVTGFTLDAGRALGLVFERSN